MTCDATNWSDIFLSLFSSINSFGRNSISPMIALSNELLPDPTSPIMHIKSPFLTCRFIFLRVIESFKVIFSSSLGICSSFYSEESSESSDDNESSSSSFSLFYFIGAESA